MDERISEHTHGQKERVQINPNVVLFKISQKEINEQGAFKTIDKTLEKEMQRLIETRGNYRTWLGIDVDFVKSEDAIKKRPERNYGENEEFSNTREKLL